MPIGPGNIIKVPLTPPQAVVPVITADDGLSLTGTTARLGEPAAAPTGLATLLDNRLIPMATKFLNFLSQLGGQYVNFLINETKGEVVLENDFSASPIPASPAAYEIRNKAGAAPPFNQVFHAYMGLTNTGTMFFKAFDPAAPATGQLMMNFQLQDFGGTSTVMTIFYNPFGHVSVRNTFDVGAGGPLNNGRLTVSNDGDAAKVLATYKNGDAGANNVGVHIYTNDIGSMTMALNGSNQATDPNSFAIDNSTLGGDLIFKNGTGQVRVKKNVGALVNGGTASGNALDVNGFINSSDPGGGAAGWKLGTTHAAAAVLDNTQYLEVNVQGVGVVKIALIV